MGLAAMIPPIISLRFIPTIGLKRAEAKVTRANLDYNRHRLAALRHDRSDAPSVLDGPINGQLFTSYVEQFLVPTLSPGDIVIMDNLGSHKGQAVHKAIRAAGAKLLFLPPCSPDLNPIKQMFAKLKLLLRKTANGYWQRQPCRFALKGSKA
jgi:transposase